MQNRESFLWVEKYRPKNFEHCILPDDLKKTFKSFVDAGEVPNLLLCGTAGIGKTTVAKAMLDEIGATSMMINGSEESGIDVLRTKIKNFASTSSLEGGRKYLILDESDYLNPQSTQPALRGFMEEFHKNCRFIFTCNLPSSFLNISPESILPVASEPLCGPVKPKQGILSPFANLGKYSCF